MKIKELLREDAAPKLIKYLEKNENKFEHIGHCYLFVWSNQQLRDLFRAGAKSNDELKSLVTPSNNSVGLGIVNTNTGDICVGAIDGDYEALWASSNDDPTAFFASTRNKKLLKLPNRLQRLAELLSAAAESDDSESDDDYKTDKTGVDAIIDILANDPEYSDIKLQIDPNFSPDEAKAYIEDELDKLKQQCMPTKKKRLDLAAVINNMYERDSSEEEIAPFRKQYRKLDTHDLEMRIQSIEKFLNDKQALFGADTEDEDEDEDDIDSRAEIDNWMGRFSRDFPNLDINSAYELDPNS